MKDFITEVRFIACSLLALYTTSFLIYYTKFKTEQAQGDLLFLMVLFAALVMACIGVYFMREWGRLLLIVSNFLLGLYIVKPHLIIENFVPVSYLFMCVIVLLFFNQSRVKNYFLRRSFKDWRSVLIVDDDEIQIKLIRPILMSNGFSVLSAVTGEDGLRVAETQNPDVILLDVILPGIKGRDVCKKLKENSATQDIPVIFCTAKDSKDDIAAELEAGAVAHLTKPIDAKELISTIQSVLTPQKKS